MARYFNEKRRPSTKESDERVMRVYNAMMKGWGDIAPYIARTEIYRRVADVCKLAPKSVQRIINHLHC